MAFLIFKVTKDYVSSGLLLIVIFQIFTLFLLYLLGVLIGKAGILKEELEKQNNIGNDRDENK